MEVDDGSPCMYPPRPARGAATDSSSNWKHRINLLYDSDDDHRHSSVSTQTHAIPGSSWADHPVSEDSYCSSEADQ
eukprot:12895646-Prorocentrum_lima.AAC.1